MPHLRFHAFDFAMHAIEQIKLHPDYKPKRVHAFVYDLTSTDSLLERLQESEAILKDSESPLVDLISCIFVLSAIPPEKQAQAIRNLCQVEFPNVFPSNCAD